MRAILVCHGNANAKSPIKNPAKPGSWVLFPWVHAPADAQLHFQIVAVDLSGNQAATGDQMVAGQSHVYLPLVRRR